MSNTTTTYAFIITYVFITYARITTSTYAFITYAFITYTRIMTSRDVQLVTSIGTSTIVLVTDYRYFFI